MPATFISYSREDGTFVLRLAQDLNASGANVWLDKLEIKPGQRWPLVVQEALTKCPQLLVVMSPSSVESQRVQEEVFFAIDEGKTVIPVFYLDCKVPYQLRVLQYADFRTDYDDGFNELVNKLAPERATRQSIPAGSHSKQKRKHIAKTNARRKQEQTAEQKKLQQAHEDSADGITAEALKGYTYEASVNALSGEIARPFRQIISPQAFILLRGDEGFFSQASHGFRVEWLVSFAFARTHVAGNTNEDGWNTLANATVEKLNLFDVVTADRIVAQVSIDRVSDKNRLPMVNFLGTTFENLRIGGKAVEIDLETGMFEHGRFRLEAGASGDSDKDRQGRGSSDGSLVKMIRGGVPLATARNSLALQGFGTLFLGQLLVDGDSYMVKMIHLVTSSGGEIDVATCRAGIGLSGWEARHPETTHVTS
jgi:TIR domain